MRRPFVVGGAALAAVGALAAGYAVESHRPHSEAAESAARRILYYEDPMHPAYRSDHPGIAPDCGMALVPVFAGEPSKAGAPRASASGATVTLDPDILQSVGIRVAPVEAGGATRTLRVVGRVVPEDTRVYRVNSGVDGFIRETYNDSVGTLVTKNQKLATYYSPDFLAVASGFLAASERVPGAAGKDGARTMPFPGTVAKQGISSLKGYTDRLRNLGMSDIQIQQVADSRLLPESIDVVAPANGFILARNISPGQHFEHASEFYRIADLSRVWVDAEIDEQEAPRLHPGGAGHLTLRGEARSLPVRIADSLPQSEAGGGTVKLRLEADNPRFVLRPEMLVDIELPVRLPAALTVPLDALVDSGVRSRVYVERQEGVFEPREVETGWRSGDRVEIVKGLKSGERVVVAATFLVDSESRLRAPAPQPADSRAGTPPAHPGTVEDPSCGMTVDPRKAAAAGNSLTDRGVTYYFCSRHCKDAFQKQHAVGADRADARQGMERD